MNLRNQSNDGIVTPHIPIELEKLNNEIRDKEDHALSDRDNVDLCSQLVK